MMVRCFNISRVDCCSVESTESSAHRFDAVTRERAVKRSHWQRAGAFCAAVAVALLPKCPACWSVYASLSSVLGVSFVLEPRLLRLLTFASLALALLSLASHARRRRSYAPLALAVASAAGVWLGRFTFTSELLTHASLLALIGAALAARRLGVRGSELAEHPGAR
jgi:hypothetical protein